ncbi:MAG: cation-translocating P-type ATPase [Nitrososphaerota archaeon]|nr:cation-translocating P-type ATPase [Nitrososphaerota archaeon]
MNRSGTREDKEETTTEKRETTVATTTTQFYIGGMACAFCASTIEKGLKHVNGVDSSKVLMESGEVFVRHDPSTIGKDRLKAEIQRLGYYVFEGRENMSNLILADSKKRALTTWAFAAISFAIVFPLMFSTMISSALIPSYYSLLATLANFILATIVFFYWAMPIHRGTITALRKRILNEHVLYGVAGFASYLLGMISFFIPVFRPFFFIAILLTGLHLTAGWLGARLRFNVEKSVSKLMDLRPPMARVVSDGRGREEQIPVSEVKIGDTIVVRPGERVPLDGTVISGRSEVSEAILTGESSPVAKEANDSVIGGSTNGSGVLTIRTTSDFGGSYISRIIGLVRSAKQTRSTNLTFFDRIVDRIWVPMVLIIAFLTLIGWIVAGLLIGNPAYWETGAVAALLVAVIGYPCAIGFSSPSVGLSVFSEYADNGILVKDTSMFERLKDVKTVIFDKTGTLTYGNPRVVNTVLAGGITKETLLKFASSLENESTHPVARAIVDEGERQKVALIKTESFNEVSGAGATGIMDGSEVFVGKPEFLKSNGFDTKEIDGVLNLFFHEGGGAKSPVVVGVDKHVIGAFDIADKLRPDAKDVVSKLKQRGLELVMVTGDSERTAAAISEELDGIEFLARKTPNDKIQIVEEYKKKARQQQKKKNGKVLMVGDGLNDAAALATADIAIATAASIDISKDVAGAVLVSSNNLNGILALVENSRTTAGASAGNILLALAFNAVGIPLAILGILTASTAMIIMVLSLLGVFTNAYLTKFRLRGRLAKMASSTFKRPEGQIPRAQVKVQRR